MSSEAACCVPLRFSTAALPARERVPFWREVFGRKLVHVDIEPLANAPFEATATLRALPGLRSLSCASSTARTRRTRELVADGDDGFALLINVSGTLAASQLGRDVSLGGGDAAVFLHADPATMTHALFQHEGLVMPRAALAPLVTNIEDMAMRPIPHGNEALRLLTGYLAIVRDDHALATPELRHLVATHVHDLVAMAIGATRDGAAIAEERGMRAARLAAIKADVIAHVGDRDLTLIAVAKRHRISPRSVQLLFEREGITFSQFVIEQRLARARRMLTDPRHAAMTVNAIALAAGFGDLSHFNRSFRRRFGATPSDVRAASQRGTD
jgi:AraC-like DNA-binding protein